MASKQRPGVTPGRHERMSPVDTAWLRMEGRTDAMSIVSVMTTATPVDAAELRRVVATRLLSFPRFRQRPVTDALGASWHEAAEVDLDAHVVTTPLPEPAGKFELEQLVSRLAGERLDPARPLWQIHFVERYGEGSAWVLRVHHCYADGTAMVGVLLSLTEPGAGPANDPTRPDAADRARVARRSGERPGVPRPLRTWLDQLSLPASDIVGNVVAEGARLLESGVHQLFHPESAANLASQAGGMAAEFARVLALPDDPVTPLRGELSGHKRVAWSAPLDLAEIRTVGKALGCTVNDVLMAAIAGALGAHLREVHGFDTDELVLRASVPVDLRTPGAPLTLGNRFGLVFVDLPVGTRHPLHRVFRVHDTTDALKRSLQPPVTLAVLGVLGLLPAAAQAPAIQLFGRKGTLVASNVRGPDAPVYLCGQRIRELYFWVPQGGSMGIGVSILSYAGQVFFGIVADHNLMPEPGRLAERLGPEFERLLLATTVGRLAVGRPRRSKGVATQSRPRSRRQPKPAAGST
ncbi:MAG TPA: wax ester/triacylglycerol synthase family O-acyltransferase [Steroidobacteraceae bacterium]